LKKSLTGKQLLSKGDGVGIVATGFAPDPRLLRAGVQWLEQAGYQVRLGTTVEGLHGYFPASDEERAADFMTMVRDRSIRAIWFARGGYGSARILEHVDWAAVRRSGKLFIGYSDITALALASFRGRSPRWMYGPVVTELGGPDSCHMAGFRRLLKGETDTVRFRGDQVVVPGRARGTLLGGNLSVLVHLLGTPFMPSLKKAILVLEDVGEETYRLDRLLTHLKMSGVLSRVAGICLGRFSPPATSRNYPGDRPFREAVQEILGGFEVPVVCDLPFGHIARKRVLPLGGQAVLNTTSRTLELIPGANP